MAPGAEVEGEVIRGHSRVREQLYPIAGVVVSIVGVESVSAAFYAEGAPGVRGRDAGIAVGAEIGGVVFFVGGVVAHALHHPGPVRCQTHANAVAAGGPGQQFIVHLHIEVAVYLAHALYAAREYIAAGIGGEGDFQPLVGFARV
ncbi:hypothetical protein DRN50_08915 [Thermococci archaeon]|nr:MAG: hypothetical protein DRN50_08915 [Thermococci archaeon]